MPAPASCAPGALDAGGAPGTSGDRFDALLPVAHARVAHMAHRFDLPAADLLTAAMVGAWHAATTYDAGRGANLRTWGYLRIDGAILDHIRSEYRTRNVAGIGIRTREVHYDKPADLDRVTEHSWHHEAGYDQVEDTDLVAHILVRLAPDDADVLQRTIMDGETLRQVGLERGVCESRIHQLRARALRRARVLAEQLLADPEPAPVR